MKFADLGKKPNVLIVITDQEREVMHWPDGWAEANLPARRRLMASGLRFTRAQCNTAACSSSRATFFTGLYPAQHGVKNIIACNDYADPVQRRTPTLSSRLPNLAKVMAAAGYHVELKGKLHLTRPVGYDAAAKRYHWSAADVRHAGRALRVPRLEPTGHERPAESLRSRWRRDQQRRPLSSTAHGTAAGEERSFDDLYRQSAVNFINTYDGEKPFCLIVALVNPHDVQEFPGRGIRGAVAPSDVRARRVSLRGFQGSADRSAAEYRGRPVDEAERARVVPADPRDWHRSRPDA